MDRYSAEMIARGPTLADDWDTPTGSVHVLSLPDPSAARAFAFDEPNYQAGVYRDVLLRRWRNLLGRTMWDYPGGPPGNWYLVLGLGTGPAADLTVPRGREELIAYGPAQALAYTSRVSTVSGATPGSGGIGYLRASSACSCESKTMTDMPIPSTGASQYALTKPGALGTRPTRRSASGSRAAFTSSIRTVASTASNCHVSRTRSCGNY